MAFNFENFGKTPETSLNQKKTGFDVNSFGEQTKPEETSYSGIGSSVTNFGKDIAQGFYLAFGGQKKINDTTKQYLDNASTLTNLALKQKDSETKRRYLTMAQGMIDSAKDVGGDIIGKTRTSKQIIADALGTLGWAVSAGVPTFKVGGIPTLAKATSTVGSRLLMGTAFGAGGGAQGALNENKSGVDIVKDTAIGGALGLAISGAVEGIGYGLRKLVQTKPVKNFIGNIYNRELQPDTKDLAKSIERHATTIGSDIANAVDDAGKPVYVGGYDTMGRQAQNQIKVNASALRGELGKITEPTYSETFKKPLLEKLTEEFGALDANQLQVIDNEINKIPAELNPTQVLDTRQLVDSKIPSGFWIDPNPQRGFVGNTRYVLRGLLRDRIEELAPEGLAKELNKKIGLAIDVKDLAFLQEALRAKGKGTSSIGLWKYIATILDRTVFSPSVTTRTAQTIKNAGQMTGNIAGRNAITKGVVESIK